MLDTVSVFDAMESDNTEHRVASRRALALAHNQIERNLGRFLRAARTEEEFLERLALIQEDFSGYVTTASAEVSWDHPEHTEAALKDHYRLAAKVEFVETPADEEKQEEEEKEPVTAVTAATRTWQVTSLVAPGGGGNVPQQPGTPQQSHPQAPGAAGALGFAGPAGIGGLEQAMGPMMGQPQQAQPPQEAGAAGAATGAPPGPGGMTPELQQWMQQHPGVGSFAGSVEGKQGSPLVKEAIAPQWGDDDPRHVSPDVGFGQNDQGQYPIHPGDEAHHTCPQCGSMNHQTDPATGHPMCVDCGYSGAPANPPDAYHDDGLSPEESARLLDPEWEQDQNVRPVHRWASEEQSHQLVTCPECGGDGKTAGATKCGKCKGAGKVPNFGDSLLDAYFGRTAEDHGNTGLDGPEPKMDKQRWTPSNPGKPDYQDGSRHPTKEKDPTEVIGPMRNDHELSEIHGQGTHFKNESLPTQKGDDPFASGGEDFGPHTDTWDNEGGAVDPVTRETLSHAYLAATHRQSMGMSAMDFRMLADAIRTAPEGADKSTLANHVAQYLQHTNPLFDSERFLQAAIGQPTSGRDTYRGPGGPQDPAAINADLNGPGGFGEQLGQGLGMTAQADDVYKNPLSELLMNEWPTEQVVTAAFLRS